MKHATISDIRLGWLRRFCALERYGDLVRAAQECRIDATSLSDSIQSLEDALCRPLMAPATSHVTAFGKIFARKSEVILRLSQISSRHDGNVSIGWFQALSAIEECNSYTEAGKKLGWTRYKVMRGVDELQKWVGSLLVYGDKMIFLTVKGQELERAAKKIIGELELFRGSSDVWWHGKMKRRRVPWWLKVYDEKGPILRRRSK